MTFPSAVTRSSYGKGRYRPSSPNPDTGEADVVFGTYDTWSHAQKDGILLCHGSSADALSSSFGDGYVRWCNNHYSRKYTLCIPDLAGTHTFGNDVSMGACDDADSYMHTSWGVDDPIVLLGISMGGATALNWVRRNPAKVKAVALLMPALDIDYLHAHAPNPIPAYIDEGYPPSGWSEATYGAAHNPRTFTLNGDIPADLPMKIWYAPDDPLIPISMVTDYQAIRPQTEIELLPPGGHTSFSQYNALDSMLEWLNALKG